VVGPTNLPLLTAKQLVSALRRGGYVLIMRHASSPRVRPDAALAHPGNLKLERQLDRRACDSVRAMGAALRTLQLNLSGLICSPAFRARETIQLAGFGEATIAPELDEILSASPCGVAQSDWLRVQSGRMPPLGTNTLFVTHLPNLIDAFENIWPVALGETLVFLPADAVVGILVARIPIRDWPHLAALGGQADPASPVQPI
jgi:phosphohistidine phosphatase SixA